MNKNIFLAVGLISGAIMIIWAFFIGYYEKDVPVIIILSVITLVCLYIYKKITNKEKRDKGQ